MQKRQQAGALEIDADRQTDSGETQSLEALFAEVEALIGRMEEPELPLEEAFDAYEKGMKLIRCLWRKLILPPETLLIALI